MTGKRKSAARPRPSAARKAKTTAERRDAERRADDRRAHARVAPGGPGQSDRRRNERRGRP